MGRAVLHNMRQRERGGDARAPTTEGTAAGWSDDPRSDAELLRDIARGDRPAFGELYDRRAPGAFALAYRMLGSQREAEDLVHDVFLECWRDAARYDPVRGSVRTWLLVRIRSRALDRMRSAHRTLAMPLEESLLDRPAFAAQPNRGDALGLVHQLLRHLSCEQRVVLELGFVAGYSSNEIAAALAIPVGTVKSRTKTALDKLRMLLGGHDDPDG